MRTRFTGSNRAVFFVILALAATIILCTVVTRSVGWMRVCGGGLFLVGGFFVLLAEDKRLPVLITLAGLALFFGDALAGLLAGR